MNKLLYILIAISLVACESPPPKHKINYMFKVGDVAKLKIDSSACVIVDRYDTYSKPRYEMKYRGEDNKYEYGYAYEYELISKY